MGTRVPGLHRNPAFPTSRPSRAANLKQGGCRAGLTLSAGTGTATHLPRESIVHVLASGCPMACPCTPTLLYLPPLPPAPSFRDCAMLSQLSQLEDGQEIQKTAYGCTTGALSRTFSGIVLMCLLGDCCSAGEKKGRRLYGNTWNGNHTTSSCCPTMPAIPLPPARPWSPFTWCISCLNDSHDGKAYQDTDRIKVSEAWTD